MKGLLYQNDVVLLVRRRGLVLLYASTEWEIDIKSPLIRFHFDGRGYETEPHIRTRKFFEFRAPPTNTFTVYYDPFPDGSCLLGENHSIKVNLESVITPAKTGDVKYYKPIIAEGPNQVYIPEVK